MLIFCKFNEYHSVNNSCEFGCDKMTNTEEIKELILVSIHKIYLVLNVEGIQQSSILSFGSPNH